MPNPTTREIVDLTQSLMRFKSMHSRPEEIHNCIDFIAEYLNGHAIDHQPIVHNQTPSMLVLPEKGFAPILLMSHIDVVDAPDALFEPRISDGNLYGRGSIDDKYAAALSLVLFKNMLTEQRRQGRGQASVPFGVLITGDEETGGEDGARHALNHHVKTRFGIALDGGQIEKIVTREKGMLKLKLVAAGKAAHGARPWLGINAIERLFKDIEFIKTLFTQDTPDHWHRTLNFSMIHAGKSHNQVPDRAEGTLDIRFTDHDDMDAVLKQIQTGIDSQMIVESRDPLFNAGRSPYLDLLLKIAADSRTGFEHGGSDARFLTELGIAGIVWGADGDMSQHSPEEHVRIDSITRLYDLLAAFVRESKALAAPPSP